MKFLGRHIESESILPDGKITIRLFEYESYACGITCR